MAIGRRFEEALCKAVRMAHPSLQGLMDGSSMFVDKEFVCRKGLSVGGQLPLGLEVLLSVGEFQQVRIRLPV